MRFMNQFLLSTFQPKSAFRLIHEYFFLPYISKVRESRVTWAITFLLNSSTLFLIVLCRWFISVQLRFLNIRFETICSKISKPTKYENMKWISWKHQHLIIILNCLLLQLNQSTFIFCLILTRTRNIKISHASPNIQNYWL